MSAPGALVTGGTSGIGKATAELLHSRGYRVMVTGVDHVADTGLPDDVLIVRADARSLPDIDHAMDKVRQHLGSLDLLFLNAGVSRPGPIESTDEAAFDALVDINVKGSFFTLQKALPLLNEGSSVVFTVGAGEGLGAAITAAKGALLPLMRALAIELAARRIRVNAVSPGLIDTPAYSKLACHRRRSRPGVTTSRSAAPATPPTSPRPSTSSPRTLRATSRVTTSSCPEAWRPPGLLTGPRVADDWVTATTAISAGRSAHDGGPVTHIATGHGGSQDAVRGVK